MKCYFSILLLFISVSAYAQTETEIKLAELEARIDELEELVEDKADQDKNVASFIAQRLNFGGIYGSVYQGLFGEEENNFGFTENNLEIFISPRITSKLDLFIAAGFLSTAGPPGGNNFSTTVDPGSNKIVRRINPITFKNPLIIGYGRWTFNNKAKLLFGKKMVDFGIIIKEHFPQSLHSFFQPQFVRPFPGNTVVANFAIASWFTGRATNANTSHEYTAYFGSFDGNPNEKLIGTDYQLGLNNDQVKFGISWQHGTRNNSTPNNVYDSVDFYTLINTSKFMLKSEFVLSNEDSGLDKTGFYIQPIFKVHTKFEPFLRYDYFDAGTDMTKKTEIIIGSNFFPASSFRVRTELVFNIYDIDKDEGGRDRNFTGLAITAIIPF